MLSRCSEHVFLAPVFFRAVFDPLVSVEDRIILQGSIQFLAPIYPKKIRKIIKKSLISYIPEITLSVCNTSPDAALFLLQKIPKRLVNLDVLH